MPDSETLFDVVAVHCFFNCGEVVRDTDPQAAHDRMERHYTTDHGPAVALIVGHLAPNGSGASDRIG